MTNPDWFSPQAVTLFTKPMVRWLIPLLPMLRSGQFPPKPSDSGYFDQEGYGQHQFKPGAKFEKPADIYSELTWRIQQCKIYKDGEVIRNDGFFLQALYKDDPEDELAEIQQMALCHEVTNAEMNRRVQSALTYISGRDRKKAGYRAWLNHRRADE